MEGTRGGANDAVPYILVHSDREIRRLNHQGGIINPIMPNPVLSGNWPCNARARRRLWRGRRHTLGFRDCW